MKDLGGGEVAWGHVSMLSEARGSNSGGRVVSLIWVYGRWNKIWNKNWPVSLIRYFDFTEIAGTKCHQNDIKMK